MGPVKLELQKDLARHLRGGHPWVYRRAVERPPPGLSPGAIVDVTAGGKFVARGYLTAGEDSGVPPALIGSRSCAGARP